MSMMLRRRAVIASAVQAVGPGVSGNALWLKADALSLSDGDPVSTWTDSSGNGFDVTASSTARPTYKSGILDGLPVVRFNGTSNRMDFAPSSSPLYGSAAGTQFTVVKVVADPGSSPATSTVLNSWGNDNVGHFPFTDGNVYDEWGTTARKSTGNPTPALTGWNIYVVQTASGLWRSYFNGGSTHYTTSSNTVIWNLSPKVGAASSTWWTNGDVAEILCYSSQLSTTDINTVGAYLDAKYPSLSWTNV